jgi:hypothetical protein
VLNAKANNPNVVIYNDLGDNGLYGTFVVSTTSTTLNEVLSVPLNASALADITAHAGLPGLAGDFFIGGAS